MHDGNHYSLINFYFSKYLAACKTECWYIQNGIQCIGKLILKYLRRYDETVPLSYFIGYTGWKINKKFYQFINIKENVDLKLL